MKIRSCDNPPPADGGNDCEGKKEKEIDCNTQLCPVNGNWSEWKDSGKCNKTCGGGKQMKIRSCDNPPPADGGNDCEGKKEKEIDCNTQLCPVNGNWSEWKDSGKCNKTCGGGKQMK